MSKQREIGGRMFSFGTIPATEAVRVEVAIARVIGEPLFKAFTEKVDGDKAVAAAAAAIGVMAAKMDADELLRTMTTVFQYVSVDNQRVDINTHFTGRNKELWQVFIAALQHNFSDFLPAGLLPFVQGKTAAESK